MFWVLASCFLREPCDHLGLLISWTNEGTFSLSSLPIPQPFLPARVCARAVGQWRQAPFLQQYPVWWSETSTHSTYKTGGISWEYPGEAYNPRFRASEKVSRRWWCLLGTRETVRKWSKVLSVLEGEALSGLQCEREDWECEGMEGRMAIHREKGWEGNF